MVSPLDNVLQKLRKERAGQGRRRSRLWPILFSLLVSAAACAGDGGSAGRPGVATDSDGRTVPPGVDAAMVEWRSDGVLVPSQDSLRRTPGYVVDSIFPPEEALRRFQAATPGPAVSALAGGERNSDALLRRYWNLLVQADTLAMTPLVVSRAEFAWLYFPEGYEKDTGMQPEVAWLLLGHQTGRGLTRALMAANGRDSSVVTTFCTGPSQQAGQNTVYGPCGVAVPGGAGLDTIWIAKSLISRDGIHKFIGLQNEL